MKANKPDSARNALMWAYKNGARKRGLAFNLSKEQFNELVKGDCWYCGVKPAQIKYSDGSRSHYCLYNGVDRVDNAVGYVEANCIPCCGQCNRMKGVLHAEDFIIHIRKLAHNLSIM